MALKYAFFILFFILNISGKSQPDTIRFVALIDGKFVNSVPTVDVLQLKFYISDIVFENEKGELFYLKTGVRLIDFEDSLLTTVETNFPINFSPKRMSFNVGLDSTINASGAMGGDLDPMLGMYWAWQSGYIHFKLETNTSKWHIGGYTSPYNTLQRVHLEMSATTTEIVCNIDRMFQGLDGLNKKVIMSPGADAVKASLLFPQIFEVKE